MIESTLKRMDGEDDPERCQAVGKHGQCPYKAVTGFKNCARHGGAGQANSASKKVMSQYNLHIWQGRVNEFSEHENVKTLRDEVGVLRMLLENTLRLCKTQTDLLIFSAKIGDLVSKIEKLVTSCHRLETSSGMMLDKSAALHLAGQMVDIIGQHVADPEAIDLISRDIAEVILNLNGADLE